MAGKIKTAEFPPERMDVHAVTRSPLYHPAALLSLAAHRMPPMADCTDADVEALRAFCAENQQ